MEEISLLRGVRIIAEFTEDNIGVKNRIEGV